jgi:hypothetical protein
MAFGACLVAQRSLMNPMAMALTRISEQLAGWNDQDRLSQSLTCHGAGLTRASILQVELSQKDGLPGQAHGCPVEF